jgi:hypothetical protein
MPKTIKAAANPLLEMLFVPFVQWGGIKLMQRGSVLTGLGIAAVGITLLFGNPADASIRITDDFGGQIGRYLDRFKAVRDSGERVIIDGSCLSACTLVLGVVRRDRICVTARARLGFHAAWRAGSGSRKVSADDGTQLLMETYPQQVRDWIAQRGGLTTQVKYLSGRELTGMFQSCA